MIVDKFRRSGSRSVATQTKITVANLSNTFLKRDGTHTVADTTDMNGNRIKNVAYSATNQDAASKNYADKNTIAVKDDVCRDQLLAVGSGPIKKMSCSNVTEGKQLH